MICEGSVSKYSMGRSTGFSIKNWQTRHMTLSKYQLAYSVKPGADAKHEMSVGAISAVWQSPSPREHPQATNPNMFMIRVWSHGVFDLLVNAMNSTEKEKWITGLKEALKDFKGVQWPNADPAVPMKLPSDGVPQQVRGDGVIGGGDDASAAGASTTAAAAAVSSGGDDGADLM